MYGPPQATGHPFIKWVKLLLYNVKTTNKSEHKNSLCHSNHISLMITFVQYKANTLAYNKERFVLFTRVFLTI